MQADASVTVLIGRLKAGDPAATRPLWDRYYRLMLAHARGILRGHIGQAVADEEDATQSAFKSFWRGAAAGRFPRLARRDDLWPLLAALTEHKAVDLLRRASRQKRGGGAAGRDLDPDAAVDRTPHPALAAEYADECRRWVDALDDPVLREVAVWRMDGHSVEEIADRLRCVPRTVERKLAVIRAVWAEAAGRDDPD